MADKVQEKKPEESSPEVLEMGFRLGNMVRCLMSAWAVTDMNVVLAALISQKKMLEDTIQRVEEMRVAQKKMLKMVMGGKG